MADHSIASAESLVTNLLLQSNPCVNSREILVHIKGNETQLNSQLRSFPRSFPRCPLCRCRAFINAMAFKPSLTLCLLVSSVFANLIQNRSPSVLLPMAVKISATGGTQALINRDRARARALFAHGQAKAKGQNLGDVPIPVTDAVVNMDSFHLTFR